MTEFMTEMAKLLDLALELDRRAATTCARADDQPSDWELAETNRSIADLARIIHALVNRLIYQYAPADSVSRPTDP